MLAPVTDFFSTLNPTGVCSPASGSTTTTSVSGAGVAEVKPNSSDCEVGVKERSVPVESNTEGVLAGPAKIDARDEGVSAVSGEEEDDVAVAGPDAEMNTNQLGTMKKRQSKLMQVHLSLTLGNEDVIELNKMIRVDRRQDIT